MDSFGERLADLRKDKQEKQRDIAQLLHVTPGTVSNYETGTHLPDITAIKTLAEHFDVSTDYLLGTVASRTPLKKMDDVFVDDLTLGQTLELLTKLSLHNRRLLFDLLNALIIRDMVRASNNSIAGGNADK